ncbi:MAG: GNAT family N-acetyltransferase [Eubacteriales bacterium]
MELHVKTFAQLTSLELYALLRARQEVFILEQNCVYLDADGTDIVATHLFYKEGEEEGANILASCRLYWDPEEDNQVLLGRVLTTRRGEGHGLKLVLEGVAFAKEYYRPNTILIHAQEYAIPFYEKADFVVCSGTFLEDGIKHKMMKISCS